MFLCYCLLFVVLLKNGRKRFNLIICLFVLFVENGENGQRKKTPPKRGLVLMCPCIKRAVCSWIGKGGVTLVFH